MTSIITAQLFITSDGKEFRSELEARGHETSLLLKDALEGYMVEAGLSKEGKEGKASASTGFLRKQVPAFLGFLTKLNPALAEGIAQASVAYAESFTDEVEAA